MSFDPTASSSTTEGPDATATPTGSRSPGRGRPAALGDLPRLDGTAVPMLDGAALDDVSALLRPVTDTSRELAVQFAAVARALESEPTVEATLQRVVSVARTIVPGCHHAGVTVIRRGRPETPAATDHVSAEVDKVQYESGQGPCLSAILESDTFLTGDLAAEERWPKFSRPAAERTGVRSVLAYRLFTAEDTMGALNLYSREVDAFGEDSVAVGSILAAHAALAFSRARERETITGLEQAVASNRQIGTAIGILMAIRKITQDEAFALLKAASQGTNRKLRTIAEEVVRTGELIDTPA